MEVKFQSQKGRILFKGSILGYILGLCLTIAYLYATRKAVPALLFILPTQAVALAATAYCQNGWQRVIDIVMFDEDKTLREQ